MTPTSRAPLVSDLAWANAQSGATSSASEAHNLGPIPEWDLSDLYKGIDDPEVARDVERAAAEAKRIKESYQGKLASLAANGDGLAEAIAAYEQLADLMGKLGSFAGLLYAANQADPARAKFYGDMSEKLTKISTDLIFFDLELNLIDAAVLETAMKGAKLSRYKPWLEDLRKEKPYQLDEKLDR